MSFFSRMPPDAPQTRERRRAILAQAKLTAPLAEAHLAHLLAASTLATCPGGTVLFTSGDMPGQIFLVASGTVQLRARAGGLADTERDPAMHLCLRVAGEVVADREMTSLSAGIAGSLPRRLAAIVLGEPAEILAIDQTALARVLSEDQAARARLAADVAGLIENLERLIDELAGLKNLGKIRLARLLLEFFDRMGRLRGEVVQIPHLLSQADMAGFLGLTRRSVFDDILALEDFGAIDHDRTGHLVLRDRARLARIARLEPSGDRDIDASAWVGDVEVALACNDTLHGFELAREALLYHPRDGELRYLSVLAALRAGALEDAEKLIAAYRFSAVDAEERVAALAARVLKERAFASQDRETMRGYAVQSAELYEAAHARTGGAYSALNAASMYCTGGHAEAGLGLARNLVAGRLGQGAGYWAHATQAEALWLLGEEARAAEMLCRATACADADDGKIGTTRLQLQRLAAALGRDATMLATRFPVRKMLVCTAPPSAHSIMAHDLAGMAGLFVAVTALEELTECAALEAVSGIDFILAAPAETLLRRAPARAMRALSRGICHLADTTDGPVSHARRENAWRRAAGLCHLAARERGGEAALLDASGALTASWPGWAAPDSLALGQSAILWAQMPGEPAIPDLVGGVPAAERKIVANAAILRFSTMAEALQAATSLRAQALGLRLCLDVENLSAVPLETACLARMQPLIRAGEIFASEAAACELALLRRPALQLTAIGRVRSQSRMNRMAAWVLRDAVPWA